MAVHNVTDLAQQIGQSFAATVAEQPIVQALWASTYEDSIDLWLTTEHADPDATWPLYSSATALLMQFPELDLRVHVLNRRNYPAIGWDRVIPANAVLITRFAATG